MKYNPSGDLQMHANEVSKWVFHEDRRHMHKELLKEHLTASTERVIDLIKSLVMLKKIGYVHLDIKPENVMVLGDQAQNKVQLIDFTDLIRGSEVDDGDSSDRFLLQAPHKYIFGTKGYMAPEAILRNRKSIGRSWVNDFEASMVFSVGATLLAILFGIRGHKYPSPSSTRYLNKYYDKSPLLTRVQLTLQVYFEYCDGVMVSHCLYLYTPQLMLQKDPTQRPRLENIIGMLDGSVELKPKPKPQTTQRNNKKRNHQPCPSSPTSPTNRRKTTDVRQPTPTSPSTPPSTPTLAPTTTFTPTTTIQTPTSTTPTPM